MSIISFEAFQALFFMMKIYYECGNFDLNSTSPNQNKIEKSNRHHHNVEYAIKAFCFLRECLIGGEIGMMKNN